MMDKKISPYMRGVKPKRLTVTEEIMIEKELRDTGHSQIMPSRIGYRKQLDRIERKLDWLIIKSQLDFFASIGMHADQEQRDQCRKNIKRLEKQLPDLSDIGLKERK